MTGNMVLDEYGDREPDYWISDMDPETGVFHKIAEVLNTDSGTRVCKLLTSEFAYFLETTLLSKCF